MPEESPVAAEPTLQRFPIRRAILGGLGGIVFAGLVMLAGSSANQMMTTAANNAATLHAYERLDTIRSVQVAEEQTRSAVLVASQDLAATSNDAIVAKHVEMDSALRLLVAEVASDPTLAAEANAASSAAEHWYETWALPIHDVIRSGDMIANHPNLTILRGDELFAVMQTNGVAMTGASAAAISALLSSTEQQSRMLLVGIGVAALALCLGVLLIGRWLVRVVTGPLQRLNETAFAQMNGAQVHFVAEHDDEVGALARVLERLRQTVEDRYTRASSEAHRAATMNKLGDLISFSSAESEVINGTVRALRRLVTTRRGDVQLSNSSRNRLLYVGAWGALPPDLDSPVPVDRIDRCPAIRRASPFVAPDVADDLAVLCARHPQDSGALPASR